MQVEGHQNGPLPGTRWLSFLQKATLGLGCLLLASALICWVAANWEHASVFQKLAGAQALLIAVVLLAWRLVYLHVGRSAPDFSAAAAVAGLAAVGTGALLALVGQIYQTGADSWVLFGGWAVLLLPWLVVLPSIFLGLLCAVLLNVSAALYLGIYGGGFAPGHSQWLVGGFLMAAINALLLLLWECASRWLSDRWRVGARTQALLVLGWLLVSALAALGRDLSALLGVAPGLLSAALMVRYYTLRRVDMAIAAAAAFTGLSLVSIALFDWMALEAALLITILIWLVAVGFVVGRLRSAPERHRAGTAAAMATAKRVAADPQRAAAQAAADPWFISVFRLAAMGLTAILTLVFLFVVVDVPVNSLWLVGLVACAGGMLLIRAKRSAVVHEAGLTLTAAGLLLVCAGLYALDEPDPGIRAAALMAFGVVLYKYVGTDGSTPNSRSSPVVSRAAVPAYPAHSGIGPLRFLCAFSVLGVASVLTWPAHSHYDLMAVSGAGRVWIYFPAYLRLWWLAVAAIITLVVGRKRREPEFWSPLAWALAVLTQLVAWVAPAPSLGAVSSTWLQTPGLLVLWLACASLAPVVLAALLWPVRSLPLYLRVAAPLALAVASLGWTGAPGIAMAFIWIVLGQVQKRKALLVFGVIALLAYLGRFYYQLDSTLLHKSLMLSLTGAWLLLCRIGLLRLQRSLARESGAAESGVPAAGISVAGTREADAARVAPASSPPGDVERRRRAVGLFAGLVLILVVVNVSIAGYERILASGTRVVLALAPVDPRSLMQGDYMALRFDVADQLLPMLAASPPDVANSIEARQGGYLVLDRDAQGVHRLGAVASRIEASAAALAVDGTAQPGNHAWLEFRLRDGRARIVTDAWFFPEGRASQYAAARYGELRVDRSGRGLLTGLLDSELQRLD